MTKLIAAAGRLARGEGGAAAMEYTLMITAIACVLVGVVTSIWEGLRVPLRVLGDAVEG
jgi:Flp pilus assembly pilin Flp